MSAARIHHPRHPSPRLRVEPRDFRELVLLHLELARTRSWRILAERSQSPFIALGAAAAPLLAVLPPSLPRIAWLKHLDSQAFAEAAQGNASDREKRRIAAHLRFHQRVEIDLLRCFDQIYAPAGLASLLRENGLSKTLANEMPPLAEVVRIHRLAA